MAKMVSRAMPSPSCFNPLHRGKLVQSTASISASVKGASFNHLNGAHGFASKWKPVDRSPAGVVSIPSIGRFGPAGGSRRVMVKMASFNPLDRGTWVRTRSSLRHRYTCSQVSIPYIGALGFGLARQMWAMSGFDRFNPLNRGTVVRTLSATGHLVYDGTFQSPSSGHTGSGLWTKFLPCCMTRSFNPLYWGMWGRIAVLIGGMGLPTYFNPLDRGAWFYTCSTVGHWALSIRVSILYIGAHEFGHDWRNLPRMSAAVSISSIGAHRFGLSVPLSPSGSLSCFNPLDRGIPVRTGQSVVHTVDHPLSFNPLNRGIPVLTRSCLRTCHLRRTFQSPESGHTGLD